MDKKIFLTLPEGLAKKLEARMKQKNEISSQEFIRKILEKELNEEKS